MAFPWTTFYDELSCASLESKESKLAEGPLVPKASSKYEIFPYTYKLTACPFHNLNNLLLTQVVGQTSNNSYLPYDYWVGNLGYDTSVGQFLAPLTLKVSSKSKVFAHTYNIYKLTTCLFHKLYGITLINLSINSKVSTLTHVIFINLA